MIAIAIVIAIVAEFGHPNPLPLPFRPVPGREAISAKLDDSANMNWRRCWMKTCLSTGFGV
jgi:hypothetical protein